MAIDLQLSRIAKLLHVLGNPHSTSSSIFKAIHIAGTNGKGSVCAYLSHILTSNKISNGRFTSPHLITRNDSIQINNKPIDFHVFKSLENLIVSKDNEFNIGCTEFEILTCIAMQAFKESNVDVAIFEVGLGGRLDSTNVLEKEKVLCCGITKIGLDHEGLLGFNLSEIAYQKTGILKNGVPCVIDASNEESILKVARNEANLKNCQLFEVTDDLQQTFKNLENSTLSEFKSSLLGEYQFSNMAIALKITDLLVEKKHFPKINKIDTQKGISNTIWPGRLQTLNLNLSKGLQLPILLDGAHNAQAAIELGKFLNSNYRSHDNNSGLIYVIAITEGKTISSLFENLITQQDTVILTKFKEGIDGMPWIKPSDTNLLADEVRNLTDKVIMQNDLKQALLKANDKYLESNKTSKIVICGSLYLVADVLRIHNE